MSRPRSDVALAVVAIVVAAICVRLGVWQLDRRSERRARNAVIAARLALPPLELSGRMSADSVLQRRVTAGGVYDYARERVWPARSFAGSPGVALMTPLRLRDGSAVFVDRGWVPSPDAFQVDLVGYREPDSAVVSGYGVAAPRGRGDVDPRALRNELPYDLLPFVIVHGQPEPSTPARLPRRWPPANMDGGPHLSYAIQWFSFAVIALVGTAALLRKSSHAGGLRP